jgi:hypothetical protein
MAGLDPAIQSSCTGRLDARVKRAHEGMNLLPSPVC